MGCNNFLYGIVPPTVQTIPGLSDLVQDGWTNATMYANSAYTTALQFISDMEQIGNELTAIDDISVSVADPSTVLTSFVLPDAPIEPEGLEMVLPAQPIEPTLADVAGLSLPDAPTFDAALPDINLNIAKPDALAATVPSEPSLFDVTIPASPDIVLPDVPTLASISIPNAPTIAIPTFTAIAPAGDIAGPSTVLQFTEPTYTSTMLDTLRGHLIDWLNGESTGIDPIVEQAIWDRGRAREDTTSLRTIGEVARSFATRGFTMPPGALALAQKDAVQDAVSKNSSYSRDVAIKQAELEQQNRQFAFNLAWQVESGLLQQANFVAQRALDVARYTLQAGVDVFNALVNKYNAQVRGYEAEAAVYRSRIEAELAIIEVYKAQIEGQRLVGEINLQTVEIYKARVESVRTLIDLYNGQVNAANTQAAVNKTIIDGFASRVGAYEAQVRAKASEYDAYATEVNAEVSKAEVFKTQASAYTSQVQGYSALVEARVKESDAEIRINQEVPLERYKTAAQVFGEIVRAEGARVTAVADTYRSRAAVYEATAQAESSRVGAQAEQYKAEVSLLIGRATAEIDAATANINKIIESVKVLASAMQAGAQTAAQVAAGSLSVVNLSGSLSSSTSTGNSASTSLGMSMSSSNSCSDIYTHEE